LALAYPSLSWRGNDSIIYEYVEKNREEGSEPGFVISKAEGELGFDNKPDVAALYAYQIGESRNGKNIEG